MLVLLLQNMQTNRIKIKPQLRSYNIDVDVYDRVIHLYIGRNIKEAKYGAEEEFKDLNIHEDEVHGMVACVFTVENKQGHRGHIMLIGMDEFLDPEENDIDLLSVCAHESLHLSWRILDAVGIDINVNNHEAQAYLLEYLFKNCKEAIKHYIKTYKLKITL